MDHCINSLAARLMYKAADKAMGVGKTKQQAEGKRQKDTHTHTHTHIQTAAGLRTDRG